MNPNMNSLIGSGVAEAFFNETAQLDSKSCLVFMSVALRYFAKMSREWLAEVLFTCFRQTHQTGEIRWIGPPILD